MRFIFIGANHAHQMVSHKDGCSHEFLRYLLDVCNEIDIDLIAEEMSNEVLEKELTTSTAEQAALVNGIEHILCDPNSAERTLLGIPSESEIRTTLGLGDRKVGVIEQIDKEKRKYWIIRESEWLRRVESQNRNCCLFILGPDHVASFSLLLKERGYEYRVLCPRWVCPSIR